MKNKIRDIFIKLRIVNDKISNITIESDMYLSFLELLQTISEICKSKSDKCKTK